MKAIKMALVLLILCCYLAGCTTITQGVVIDKQYTEGHWVTTYCPEMVGKSLMVVPVNQFYPDMWELKVKGINGQGEEETTTISVSAEKYSKTQIGDTVKW